MKHPQGKEILNFPIENVAFAWQNNDRNVDCGIFIMNHMEHFTGSVYECADLQKVRKTDYVFNIEVVKHG